MTGLIPLNLMYVQGNKALRHPALRWPMFLAFFFVAAIFTTVVNAVGSDYLNQTLIFTSDSDENVSAAHKEHEVKTSVRPCENTDCETTADCEQSCSVDGGCTHSVFVKSTLLSHAVAPLGARPCSVSNKLSDISSEPSSLFRPPRV